MMTKETILRLIEEIESKFTELRQAMEIWPERTEQMPTDPLADLFQEDTEEDDKGLESVFGILRVAWAIPADYKPEITLDEAQNALAKGMLESWASREIIRMREE
jgi:hypothetical protein